MARFIAEKIKNMGIILKNDNIEEIKKFIKISQNKKERMELKI